MTPSIPDAAIGAVAAALIAATISLVGLIVSKEQKTSEFRQAWIDCLRTDLIGFLTSINAAQDALKLDYKTPEKRLEALRDHYAVLNNSTFSILLRVNPREGRSKRVLNCLGQFNKLLQNPDEFSVQSIKPIQVELLLASQDLLKFEWGRVKSGELTFKATKTLAALVIATCVALVIWIGVTRGENPPPAKPSPIPSSPTPVSPPDATHKLNDKLDGTRPANKGPPSNIISPRKI